MGQLVPIPFVSANGALDDFGRTEDIKFSPSGRLLAVTATEGRVLFFTVDAGARPIRIDGCTQMRSPALASPHGVDFVSEDIIVVANRSGAVTFHRVLPGGRWGDTHVSEPIGRMHSSWFGAEGTMRKLRQRSIWCGPGSVRVHGGAIYVCCNNLNTVSVHPYRLNNDSVETDDGPLAAQEGLAVPDGVALSRDGRWMAVSNHDHRCVFVYQRSSGVRSCVLRDASLCYPHGLCFHPDGKRLYVADAGGRELQVFATARDWSEDADTCAYRLSAVREEAFCKTHAATGEEYRALEGGIKGIDLDPAGRVLATTCQNQALRFFET